VHPYHLACVENRWYLVAHDPAREAMRNFAMTRMRRVLLLEDKFTLPKGFRIEDHLKGSFGIFQAGDDFEVVVDFDKWAGELVRERKWHRSQQLVELPGGGVRLQLRLNNLAEVERWILSWGTHATVERPERLREIIRSTAGELAVRYSSQSPQKSHPVGQPLAEEDIHAPARNKVPASPIMAGAEPKT
jgi:predicted DNA-binding transcriptional regulator YafY